MLFNSYAFILFFAGVVILSRLIPSWTGRKMLLLLMSYAFYAAWNPPFVALLWISTVADWYLARNIHNADHPLIRKLNLACSLLVNLGLLAFFKYGNFILENVAHLESLFGSTYQPVRMNIVLPVGISFYTFQTLSYTLDIYRNKARPWHSFLDYALYVTFFPQLVAGPIVRAVDFLPQCETPRIASSKQLGWGLTLCVIGLFNKMVIADLFLSPVAEAVFDSNLRCGMIQAWAGTLAFSGQIFCDFSGYSTCAIGVALCLGFALPDNFKFPYAAVGFSDFWRRWHISLSTWLKDYLYITLGGNRRGRLRTYVNLMMTMLIGGLWHGASWLFVIWGGLHGLYLVVERLVVRVASTGKRSWENGFLRIGLAMLTYFLVCVAWVFFRAKTLSRAFSLVRSLFDFKHLSIAGSGPGRPDYDFVLFITVAMLVIHWCLSKTTLENAFAWCPMWLKTVAVGFMLYCLVTSFTGEDRAFIYFQF